MTTREGYGGPGFSLERHGARIALEGDLRTPLQCERLRELIESAAAEAAPHTHVVLDVARAGYLDSRAHATIVHVARKCRDAGVTLVLEGAHEDLLALLRTTHVDEILTLREARV